MSKRYRSVILKTFIGFIVVCGIFRYLQLIRKPDFDRLNANTIEFNAEDIPYNKINDVDIHASNYDTLFQKIDYREFIHFLLNEKCDLYFKNMYMDHPEWQNDPKYGFSFSKQIFTSFETYKEHILKKLQEGKQADEKLPSDDDIKVDYQRGWEVVKKDEQTIHNYMSNIVLYHRCYVENHRSHLDQQDLFKRIFPYLTGVFPTVEDYNLNPVLYHKPTDNKPYFQAMKQSLNGRGIVLTIKDSHVDDMVRLVKLLRHLKNQLPIQVIYWKNLSLSSKKVIIQACRAKMIIGNEEVPKQVIYFMDVRESIDERFQFQFEGFGNKVLATIFNTFEEMILVDADTIILKPPVEFFDMEKYRVNGTVFFKDRKAVEFRPPQDLVFFKKMIPSKFDSLAFDINQPTNYTLSRSFFKGYSHYMESGLVVINKKRHFFKPFIMAQLNFIYPVNARVYGDKEFFWLSFLIMGDESYSFNRHFAAAIGELTPQNEREADIGRSKEFRGKELCSNHPAHINDEDDHALLWFNSGFKFCGQLYDAEKEFEVKKRYTALKTLEEFKTFFDSKLTIKQAIIPPSIKVFSPKTDGESDKAWLNMMQYCHGYTWCAYSSIGEEYDEAKIGYVIDYNADEIRYFGEMGDIWTGVTDVSISPLKDLELTKEETEQLTNEGLTEWFDKII